MTAPATLLASPHPTRGPRPTASTSRATAASTDWVDGLAVEIVVPVFDEARVLEASTRRLHEHLGVHAPFTWQITIVDNASTDGTPEIARRLAAELPGVAVCVLPEKGRGRAVRSAWSASEARVVAYMDVDLSTDLGALVSLVTPLLSGHCDLAIGSRLAPGASVVRTPKRDVLSRAYNLLLRRLLGTRIRDMQCGFKAARTEVARELLPAVLDEGWFFDTEMLLRAEHGGLRVLEVPVDWVDDPDSRVDLLPTIWHDLVGSARMARTLARGDTGCDLASVRRLPHAGDDGRTGGLRLAVVLAVTWVVASAGRIALLGWRALEGRRRRWTR